MKKWILFFLIFIFSSPAFAATEAANRIRQMLHDPLLRGVRIGIEAEVLGSRQKIVSVNANLPMIPASNQKLLTSACALFDLGPTYHFTTTILGGKIAQGRLRGNLILHGSGDPTWSLTFLDDPTKPLVELAKKLKTEGLRQVNGDLVVDDSIFDRQYLGKGWKARYEWEDYAAEVGGLSLNNNEVQVSVAPGSRLGQPAKIILYPDNHVLKVINRTWTDHTRSYISYNRDRIKNQVIVLGPINRHSRGTSFSFNIHDPPLFVGSAFAQILKRAGIRITGRVRLINHYEIGKDKNLRTLAAVESPPLLEIIHKMNKESDNFLAEHLFRRVGAAEFGKGTTINGLRAVKSCTMKLGVSDPVLRMVDGSGLSDLNRVSPATFVGLLQGISEQRQGAEFEATLPHSGLDGTLEDRLSDVDVRAKTGAIRGVNSLSGYLKTKNGQTLVFSIILNNYTFSSATARDIIDRMVRILAESEGRNEAGNHRGRKHVHA